MATNYTEMVADIESAKKRGLSRTQYLVSLCQKAGCNLKTAEAKYLGLLHLCVNLPNESHGMALWDSIRFCGASEGDWTVITSKRIPKRFDASGESRTIHANLKMHEVLSISRKSVKAIGKERVIRIEILFKGKVVKSF